MMKGAIMAEQTTQGIEKGDVLQKIAGLAFIIGAILVIAGNAAIPRDADPGNVKEGSQIPHLRLLGWLLWAYSRCGVSTGVLIGLCAASLRGLATVSRQLWSLSG